VTLGSYAVAVDETPMSRSFMEAQFEELLALKQMGMPIPDDFLIDASSMNRKQELKASLAAARAAQAKMGHNGGPPMDGEDGEPGNPAGQQGPGPGGSRVGLDGGSLPSGPEPGAPVPMAQ
jgi:4'-phosphopantetheinyl transferase EntD